jgi:hypothetical protein
MTAVADSGLRTKELLSGLFGAGHLGQLAWGSTTQSMLAAREILYGGRPKSQDVTVAELLDTAFATLADAFPVEYVFKSCAVTRLLFGRHSPRTTSFYVEFPIGESRADVVAVNGQAHVYEIKTRYDDFSRLSAQLDEYYRAFSYVTLFVDEAHATAVVNHVPQYTGIAVLSKKFSMRVLRPAIPRQENLDSRQLFRVLHEREYLSVLQSRGIEVGRVDPADRYRFCLEAASRLDVNELQAEVVLALKRRQATTRLADIAQTLPESLRLAPFAYRMTLEQWKELSARMVHNV